MENIIICNKSGEEVDSIHVWHLQDFSEAMETVKKAEQEGKVVNVWDTVGVLARLTDKELDEIKYPDSSDYD